jgi:hypothetical protein
VRQNGWRASLSGLHDAAAQSVSPYLMVTFSDYGNVLGQLHTIYGLVGVGVDQAVARSKFPSSPILNEVKRNPCGPGANEVSKWSD